MSPRVDPVAPVARPGPRPARAFGAAATASALALLAGAAWQAWREAALQGWDAHGLTWLALERFALARPLVPALATGGLVLLIALAARRMSTAARLYRATRLELFGHPLCALAALGTALLLPGVVVRGTRPAPARQAPSVVVVVVDTWRADHAGFLGYARPVSPALDRLAESGVVFERAMAQSSWTKPSVATLLTGLVPARHRAVSQSIAEAPVRGFRLAPRLTTLIEVLHGRGWQTAMWSDNPNITPPTGFAQGAEHFRDYFHEPCHPEGCGRIDEMLADVETWLAEERDPARPFCLYVHVMDAHYPFEPPPGYRGTFDRSPSDLQLSGPVVHDYMTGQRSEANLTPARLASLVDRYDEELLAIDQQLGPFLERLRRAHPNTVIVLAGDHGEEFHEHGNLGHGHALWQELVHVPLVILTRTLDPARVATQVRLMDVAPTLLELVGLPDALPGAQGESLLPVIAGLEREDRLAPMEVGGDQKPCWQWRGASDGTTKVLRREADLPTRHPVPPLADEDALARPYWHLYDLAADPTERENLARNRAADARALFDRLEHEGWYVAPGKLLGWPATSPVLDPALARELAELGYGGGADGEP
jgi:arylsulfatase A-like enzyme